MKDIVFLYPLFRNKNLNLNFNPFFQMTHRSPPSHPPPPPPPGMSPAAASAAAAAIAAAATSGTGPGTPGGGNSSYHSATWERTLRMNSSSSLGNYFFMY
jgi:hypothetical protein